MKLSTLLALPAALVSAVLGAAAQSTSDYSEHLHLKPLPGDFLYAGFNFTATTSLSDYENQHFRLFPRSLAQILQNSHTQELHLRFALGRWDEESWGSRPRDGRREGGTGVELWAWLDGSGGAGEVERRWSSLVNSLSGLFCASLNFIDGTKTTRPVLSFEPEGQHRVQDGELELLHGTLPHEIVCTENLTPFLKLLPCKGKAGLGSLLDGHKVFDANWQSMSVDVRPVCVPGEECKLEIQQTVDLVLDIERSMRPRDDPIPRPRPVEELQCDESKSYNSGDTCYPQKPTGEMAWSLSQIFGQPVQGNCHLSNTDAFIDISLEVPADRTVTIPEGFQAAQTLTNEHGTTRFYILSPDHPLDLTLPYQQDLTTSSSSPDLPRPPLHISRQITGYGAERGGIHAVLRNPHPYPQRIVYLESLPWFMRPYMHTLTVRATAGTQLPQTELVEAMYYTPALDRQRATRLELLLSIPAHSTIELTYEFEKAVLRYTEYPPDANRGFDVPAAVVRVLGSGEYIRTTTLLLPLPTPDFSMPYNVIILTSTVIALGFGSIFNLLVRRFVLVEEVPGSPLAGKIRGLVDGVRGKMGTRKVAEGKRVDGVVKANGNAVKGEKT